MSDLEQEEAEKEAARRHNRAKAAARALMKGAVDKSKSKFHDVVERAIKKEPSKPYRNPTWAKPRPKVNTEPNPWENPKPYEGI
jgi:hypothetical protein